MIRKRAANAPVNLKKSYFFFTYLNACNVTFERHFKYFMKFSII